MLTTLLKNKRFLVVDDEQATVEIVKEVLNSNGAKATGLMNPEKCMSMIAQDKYDGVILDRYMPQMDGLEVLQQLQANAQTKEIPVVMLTGESSEPEIKRAIEAGAVGYVAKPFTPKSFLSQLEKILKPKEEERLRALEEAKRIAMAAAQGAENKAEKGEEKSD